MKGTPVGSETLRRRVRAGVGSAACAAALVGMGEQADAKPIVVRTTDASGKGSFAAAVERANAKRDRSTITFKKSLKGTIPLKGTVKLTKPTVIKGQGYGDEDGSNFGRVKFATKGGGKANIEARATTLADGLYLRDAGLGTDGSGPDSGSADLTVRRSFVDGEGAAPGKNRYSFGVFGFYGDVTLENTTVTGFGKRDGGGVAVLKGAEVTILESTIEGNFNAGVVDSGGKFEIVDSTISGNQGSGIFIDFYGYGGTIVNSTISGNSTKGNGGGIEGYPASVSQSTITDNTAVQGGGIHVSDDPTEKVTVSNSIVAGNTSTAPGAAEDCAASGFTSTGGNLVGSPGSCTLQPTDISGVPPLLGPLADNGGPTFTHALLPGSPAIGLAIPANATPTDQRGVARDADPDSGSFELAG